MNPTAKNPIRLVAGLAVLLLAPLLSAAAPSDPAIVTGFKHPFVNLDHLVALLVIGLAAAQFGRRAAWGLPTMFAALFGFGMILGHEGAVMPMLDTIFMTVALAIALLILGQVHLLFALVATGVGAFALFHGLADGMLVRQTSVGLAFLGGFTASTLAVLAGATLLGVWLHPWLTHLPQHWTNRMAHLHG